MEAARSTESAPPQPPSRAALAGITRQRVRERLINLQRSKKLWPHDRVTFARDRLIILPKESGPIPFVQNSVQAQLDADLDNLLAEHGWVRAIILKARQLGISTGIGGRFYHSAIHEAGVRCLIEAHRNDATANLFGMVRRFHENDPAALDAVNLSAKQLTLANDSGFTVQTAGAVSTGAGRSFTFRKAHLSELGFWQNPQEHLNAVLNATSGGPRQRDHHREHGERHRGAVLHHGGRRPEGRERVHPALLPVVRPYRLRAGPRRTDGCRLAIRMTMTGKASPGWGSITGWASISSTGRR